MNTGAAGPLNNDHGISPDGRKLVISHSPAPENLSIVYILPFDGGSRGA